MPKLSSLSGGKKPQHALITVDWLRTHLDYNPDTGLFTWRLHPSKQAYNGTIAGSWDRYIRIKLMGKKFPAHRLAYYWMTGEWPFTEDINIDHIDGDPHNNKWDNLRLATRSENQKNRCLNSNNRTGIKGVSIKGSKFRVYIHSDSITIDELYDTLSEATIRVDNLRKELHGDFARFE